METAVSGCKIQMWDFFDIIEFFVDLFQKWRFTLALLIGVIGGWMLHSALGPTFGTVAWVLCGLGGGVWGVVWESRANPS